MARTSRDRWHDVAIGEIITYTSTITVPEGVTNTLLWTDIPDGGLSVVDLLGVTASPGLATSQGTFADVQASALLTSANGDSSDTRLRHGYQFEYRQRFAETVAIEYRAVRAQQFCGNRAATEPR